MVVVEANTVIGDLQETLGRLDVKARLWRTLADAAGWADVRGSVPAFVFRDGRTVRRVLAANRSLFSRYSTRGRAARAWLRNPVDPVPGGLLWLTSVPNSRDVGVTRVRRARTGQS
jgi:hypothetical protein